MTKKVVMLERWGIPRGVSGPIREVTVEDMEKRIKQIEDAIPTMSVGQDEVRKYVQDWKETLKKMQGGG